jgi:hypothetical protein
MLVPDLPGDGRRAQGRPDLLSMRLLGRRVRAKARPRVIARLIHPIDVLVEQLDAPATAIDPEFREPADAAGATFRPPVSIRAQITWGTKDEFRRSAGGDEYQADGHFTFLASHLEWLGITLHKGDRVSATADRTYRYRVVAVEPAGHYHGQPHLVKAHFKRLEGND